MTVEENLLAILEMRGLERATQARARCDELLHEFGLARVARTPGYALSGGERRRAEIARALASEPRYMLLDEPFAGIDPIAVADLQRIVVRLKEKGIGVLITDHNVRETLQITDRAYIISQGRIFRHGTPVGAGLRRRSAQGLPGGALPAALTPAAIGSRWRSNKN